MADTSQTPVVTPGNTTSEYKITKLVVALASVISVLGTITTVVGSVSTVVPPSTAGLGLWLAIGGAVVAGLKSAAYEIQRTAIKIAAIQAGQAPSADPTSTDAAAASVGK